MRLGSMHEYMFFRVFVPFIFSLLIMETNFLFYLLLTLLFFLFPLVFLRSLSLSALFRRFLLIVSADIIESTIIETTTQK